MSEVPENPVKSKDLLHMIVENHRTNNGYVCPYAKLVATIKTITDPLDEAMCKQTLCQGLEEFHKEKTSSLIFVLGTRPQNHEEGRKQTETVHKHLKTISFKLNPGTSIDPRRNNRAFPFIPFGQDNLLAIGLNQLYPEQHPRYSPEPIVAVTRISDVLKLSEEQTFSIRQKAIRRLIQAHLPHLSIQEIESATDIATLKNGRVSKFNLAVDSSIINHKTLAAAEKYGMNVPLYLMPDVA